MRRLIFPLLLGLVGCAFLIRLGLWQLDRMGEKRAYLDQIEARIHNPATCTGRHYSAVSSASSRGAGALAGARAAAVCAPHAAALANIAHRIDLSEASHDLSSPGAAAQEVRYRALLCASRDGVDERLLLPSLAPADADKGDYCAAARALPSPCVSDFQTLAL